MPVIAIMNAKGGVGKSTLSMLTAEFLALRHRKSVCVIDADPQSSITHMLLGPTAIERVYTSQQHISRFFSDLIESPADEDASLHTGVTVEVDSNVTGVTGLTLIPGDIGLSLTEARYTQDTLTHIEERLAEEVRALSEAHDYVLVDCSPSVSPLTRTWLRLADGILSPVRPDNLSHKGLLIIGRLREEGARQGAPLGKNIGVVVNMVRARVAEHEKWVQKFLTDQQFRAFQTVFPMTTSMERAASIAEDRAGRVRKHSARTKYGREILGLAEDFVQEFAARAAQLSKIPADRTGHVATKRVRSA